MKSIITFILMLVSMAALDMTSDLVLRVFFKALTSVLFVLTGIFAMRERNSGTSYAKLILTGLILGFAGDVLLELANLKGDLYFVIGLVTFALGHVFYLIAFFKKSPFQWFNLIPTFIVIPAVLIAVPVTKAFEFNPPALYYAVLAYGVILTFMVGKSFSYTAFKGSTAFVRLTIIVAILFAISDIILLFILFFKPVLVLDRENCTKIVLTVFNLLTYYIGQGLIALSLRKEPRL
ncbi:MAG: lysoplasmalogenase [Treponema sp.]|nr:lysoplasmalogenase [Treponema sp.]